MVPSPEELNYFLAIANASNYSRAASKLGVSQPSLSLAIKRLEKTIGAELFIRHKHGATLTPAGKKLFLQTKTLFDGWENIRLEAAASHQQIQGEIVLGCHTTMALHLRGFIPQLLEQNPKLTFNFKHDVSQNITDQVIHSTIDIGLVNNPLRHPDLIIRKLGSSETGFWKGNGLRPTQNIKSDQLVIVCDPNIPRTSLLLKKWKNNKLKSARILTSTSLEIVADLTVAGCGIGILPACFAQLIYPGKLERIQNTPIFNDELYLIYRKENRDVKAVLTVITAIKKFVEEDIDVAKNPGCRA